MEANRYRLVASGWDGNVFSSVLVHTHKFTRLEFFDYVLPIATKIMKEEDLYFGEAIPLIEAELIKNHQFSAVDDTEFFFGAEFDTPEKRAKGRQYIKE